MCGQDKAMAMRKRYGYRLCEAKGGYCSVAFCCGIATFGGAVSVEMISEIKGKRSGLGEVVDLQHKCSFGELHFL